MGRTSIIERARRGAESVARSGLDTATFAEQIAEHISSAVPHSAACVVTLDPTTGLLTSTYKFGSLAGKHELDGRWAEIEYGSDDPTRLSEIAGREVPACATSHLAGGVGESERMRELITPMGYSDELRMVARSNGRPWGGMNLFRDVGAEPFSDAEVLALGAISEVVADGLRSGLVARCAPAIESDVPHSGPLVLILDGDSEVRRVSTGADGLLDELTSEPNRSPAESMIKGLVTHAQRFAAGEATSPPRARLRLPSGRWLVAHGAPLAGGDGSPGEIVVTVDDARPPEIVPLLAAALGLTERERDVTQLVLAGADTSGIASVLSMSRYTVQDHLKSIFDKADVRSRRELMARVFFDHHAPRLTEELAPTGWFARPRPCQ